MNWQKPSKMDQEFYLLKDFRDLTLMIASLISWERTLTIKTQCAPTIHLP